LRGPVEERGLVEDADDRGDGPEDEVVGCFLGHVLGWLAELGVAGGDVRHAAPFQTRPRTMCCRCLRWTPYSSASCAWVTPPASQRARISRTCSGVSLERLGGRYLTGCGVRARWRVARARRTSWYASTRAMTSRLVCAVRHAWSRRSWALARRRSMLRITEAPFGTATAATGHPHGSGQRASP